VTSLSNQVHLGVFVVAVMNFVSIKMGFLDYKLFRIEARFLSLLWDRRVGVNHILTLTQEFH
jgi:hypothetical protein